MRAATACALLLLAPMLAACPGFVTEKPATLPQPAPIAAPTCLPLRSYTPAQQQQAAAELSKLPQGSMIAQMVVDYGVMRDADKACLATH